MSITVVVFPFDLFGGAGSGAGAELLADELRTVLDDNRRERTSTRAAVYQNQISIKQVDFTSLDDVTGWRDQGRKLARKLLKQDGFFLWLGGNHLSVLPLYDELGSTPVLQLDAHLDIHAFSDLSPELSHGNFLLHCAAAPPLLNVGHRELLLTDGHIARTYCLAFSAERLALDPESVLGEVAWFCESGYVLDIDWDVLDAAFFPAVTRPVPFGLSPTQLLQILGTADPRRLRGVALSEFEPGRDRDDRSLTLAMWLLEWLLIGRHIPSIPGA